MLNLIFGRSGSGKTHKITEMIKNDCQNGKPCYLIVPEQQVYISERNILAQLPTDKALDFRILSFSRLASEVFGKFGGLTYASLSKGDRSLLMWKTLRDLDGMLTEYKATQDPSLSALMLTEYDQLRSNGISADMLDAAIASDDIPNSLKNKLHDLSAVCSTFDLSVSRLFGDNPADTLSRLSDTLDKHDFFSGCNVYIDSFTSFTVPEHEVLRRITRQAKDVFVSLCISSENEHGLQFDSITETCKILRKDADSDGIPCKFTKLTENRRAGSLELDIVEKYLWEIGSKLPDTSVIPDDQRGHVSLIKAKNSYSEAEAIALNILKLHESGVEFGDIAVIFRDVETRRGIIDAAMEKYGIPCFMSERTGLSSKPTARLILSSLRAVTRHYQQADVISILKTGLCYSDLRDVDLFCQYVETWKINGSGFEKELWSMNPDGYTVDLSERGKRILEAANRVRSAVMKPLSRLKTALNTAATVKEMCQAVYSYLTELDIQSNLAESARKELEMNDLREAGELLRLYDFLIGCLADLSLIFGCEKLSVDQFAVALTMLFEETDIGSVPAIHDCVVIGSAATLRVENVKVAIIAGLVDGEFPGNTNERGILSQAEKTALEAAGIRFRNSNESKCSDELFYLYRAMTTPSEKLILTMPESSSSGKGNTPSVAYTRIRTLLPYLTEEIFKFNGKAGKTEKSSGAIRIMPPEAVRKLLGDTLWLSKSKLSDFVGCPYSFYCKYILSVRERKEAIMSYSDSGTFIHYVLEHFLKNALDADGYVRKLSDEEISDMSDAIIRKYVTDVCGVAPNTLSPRIQHNFARLRAFALVMLRSILDEFSSSQFRPVAFEQIISDRSREMPSPLNIPLNDDSEFPRVALGGTVDRIDLWQDGNDAYIRIVDYKTKKEDFNTDKLLDSKNKGIQLLTYLFTVCAPKNDGLYTLSGQNIHPASAMFLYAEKDDKSGKLTPGRNGFILDNKDLFGAITSNPDKEYSPQKCKNILSEADIAALDEALRTTVRDIANQIYSGTACRTPAKDVCKLCIVKDSCPVAEKQNGN